MKFFSASLNKNHEDSTEIYVRKCKKLIEIEKNESFSNNEKTNINTNTNSNTNAKKTNLNNTNENNNKNKTPEYTPEDLECLNIVKQKDYYKILNLTKSADENEIKKSYKKVYKKLKKIF